MPNYSDTLRHIFMLTSSDLVSNFYFYNTIKGHKVLYIQKNKKETK